MSQKAVLTADGCESPPPDSRGRIGRYVIHAPIARGGMATVHTARLVAAEGITRLVAAKRLHPQYTDDPEFVAMFHDEARIASRIHHPNVVPVLDIVQSGDEVILVQEYVHGVPLSYLCKVAMAGEPIPVAIAVAIVAGILAGLHAAHEATDEVGDPLGVVHRDVSPQNVLVSVDGTPRLVDFGIAKAKTSVHHTREGIFKGKLAYMGPEQIRGDLVTRRADIYAAGVLLWELLANRRLYGSKNDAEIIRTMLLGASPSLTHALASERDRLSRSRWEQLSRLEPVVSRAIAMAQDERYETAADMGEALVDAVRPASAIEVSRWVCSVGADYLDKRQKEVAASEEIGRVGHSGTMRAVSPRSFELDHDVNSGARVRPAAEPVASFPSGAPSLDLVAAPTATFEVDARGPVPRWAVGAFLVLVGALAGVLAVRAPSSPPVPAAAASAAVSIAPARVVQEAMVTATANPSPPTVDARPSATPLTSAPTVVRSFAPAKVAPTTYTRPAPTAVPTPAAPPPSAHSDCNPPFYFEGHKKIFKPSCL